MFYVIGLGLSDEKDITVKGLEAVKRSERVYLESYTSILMVEKEKLEAFYGKSIITATRELVELEADEILKNSDKVDIAFLVVGDPLGATTHSDLLLRARSQKIPTEVIHNASILTSLGSTGLQLYSFGQTLSLVFYTENWKPDSWFDKLEENLRIGVHTLVLLDIKVREQSEENMASLGVDLGSKSSRQSWLGGADARAEYETSLQIAGRLIYEPPRFMNPQQAFSQILYTESQRYPGGFAASQSSDDEGAGVDEGAAGENEVKVKSLLPPKETLAISLSRIGTPTQKLISGTLEELSKLNEEEFGGPLHSLVIIGKKLHSLEYEFAGKFAVNGENGDWWKVGKEVYGCERESF